jgi:group II intron reverse transcriptase/maturase
MLTVTTTKRLDALGEVSKKGKRINGLFRLLENPALWLQAYANIYANKGAAIPGSDGQSLDGFSKERMFEIIKQLKESRYCFKPARRIYIPKKNGKHRPLGIPSGDDKLVAEVVRMILEKIYEPVFLNSSHGFRPNKSCHTALKDINHLWTSVKWIVNMDIQGFFDNINHSVLINLLKKKIEDKKFIHLIEMMLTAGYIEDWKFHQTYSGTPAGNIISPLLANVYLHELDSFMEDIKTEFNKGKFRKIKVEYNRITTLIRKLMKEIDSLKQQEGTIDQIEAIKKQIKIHDKKRKAMTVREPIDPDYKRLRYCRYADDFVIGIIGSKQDAMTVQDKVTQFIETQLHLNIVKEKSHIVHSQKGTQFLGYNIRIYNGDKIVKTVRSHRHTRVKSMIGKMQLHIPQKKLRSFCKNKNYGNYETTQSFHRSELINLSDAEIVKAYNAEMRGFANYYALGNNFWDMNKIMWIGRNSLLKTLAAKHKTSVNKIINRLKTPNGLALTVRTKQNIRIFKIFSLKDINREPAKYKRIDVLPNTWQFTHSRTELVQRLNARQCEYCGQQKGGLEVHHVRKLSDIKDGKEWWQIMMSRKQRKTLVLCIQCHDRLHAGKLPDWRKLRKEQVESRMH